MEHRGPLWPKNLPSCLLSCEFSENFLTLSGQSFILDTGYFCPINPPHSTDTASFVFHVRLYLLGSKGPVNTKYLLLVPMKKERSKHVLPLLHIRVSNANITDQNKVQVERWRHCGLLMGAQTGAASSEYGLKVS